MKTKKWVKQVELPKLSRGFFILVIQSAMMNYVVAKPCGKEQILNDLCAELTVTRANLMPLLTRHLAAAEARMTTAYESGACV